MTNFYRKSELYDNHKAHMENEKIEVEYTINKDIIKVTSESACTGFVNLRRTYHIEQEEIFNLIKEMKREAKKHGTKLKGINKLTEYVKEHYSSYNSEFMKYDKKFDILALLWEQNVDNIKMGHRNNAIYNEVLFKYQTELSNMLNRNCIIPIIHSYYYNLKNYLKEMQKEENKYTLITVA
ncbi:hypothetical protein [Staphylococcus equorum]|uniref:Uncharacterized protein n=1 Tax=Staphylococcus equorum TaxID=246432 RepID=A0AAP7LUX5_9STAP|nr:hypothetical protein [Staphylococcus equorum]OEK58968.1 hypothetical protein ASS94_01180 [Staphylococcus equorum]